MQITKAKKRWGIILLLLALIISLAFYPLPPQAPIQYYERESGQLKTEKVAGEKNKFIGRTDGDAPEIDQAVYISGKNIKVGEFYRAMITDSLEYDLVGEKI